MFLVINLQVLEAQKAAAAANKEAAVKQAVTAADAGAAAGQKFVVIQASVPWFLMLSCGLLFVATLVCLALPTHSQTPIDRQLAHTPLQMVVGLCLTITPLVANHAPAIAILSADGRGAGREGGD